jgi:membrane fusion protein, multidrug efflux system
MKAWIAAAIVLALGAAGLYWYTTSSRGGDPRAGFQMPPPIVEVQSVALGAVVHTVEAVGTLRANESVTIQPEIPGRVVAIGFDEGQPVQHRAVLVTLDDSVYQAEVAEKTANRRLAELAFNRADLLVAKKAAPVETRDRALAQLQAEEAGLELARARLDKTRIRAPFDGSIGLRSISVGDFVDVGQPLVSLVDLDPLKVDFRVGEIHLPDVLAGQSISVTVDAFPGQRFTGEVFAIEPQVDINGRALVVRARLPNPNGALRPGLFSRVSLIVDNQAQALLVPESAIVPQGDQHFVYRVADGRANLVEVLIGQRKDTRVEIRSGVELGDLVVSAGQLKLRDGMTVQAAAADGAVANAAPAGAPAQAPGATAKDT